MHDAEIVAREINRFTKRYPARRGWRVYRIEPGTRQYFIGVLPAFLRHAGIIGQAQESINTEIAWAPRGYWGKIRRLTGLPLRWRREGLAEDEWVGDLSFPWRGASIHVRRIWLQASMPGSIPITPACLVLIACADWESLEELFRQGMRFATVRMRKSARIIVVNGPDIPRPKLGWDALILQPAMKEQLRGNLEAFLVSKKRYREMDIAYRRGFLFAGPPGNGKTLTTKVIAGSYKIGMVTLILKSDLDERVVNEAFGQARVNAPCILLLEDLDKLAGRSRVSTSYILNKLDGLETDEGMLVIATTNEPEKLDPALLQRPSRFDRVWRFELPGLNERLALLRLKGGRFFSESALEDAARRTQGFSMAYVQEAVVSALLAAIHEKADPEDRHLAASVAHLREQIRTAGKPAAAAIAANGLGFLSNGDGA